MSSASVVVSAFYKFVSVADPVALREHMVALAHDCEMSGSILVAGEGINGTIAGGRAHTDRFFAAVRADHRFADLETKESFADQVPFLRMKVRLKDEIVTLRQDVDPTATVGEYVAPERWNQVISDPQVLVIDTRNREEVALGTFANAVDPDTDSFVEFADFVDTLDPNRHPQVAMFCTGGIRCEKASAYMLDKGFEHVMHLQGGILNYLEQVETDESMWHGECFVFDDRVSVDHALRPGSYELCRGCRRALSPQDRIHPAYEVGVSCAHCEADLSPERRRSLRERHRQVQLAEARGTKHLARHDTSSQP